MSDELPEIYCSPISRRHMVIDGKITLRKGETIEVLEQDSVKDFIENRNKSFEKPKPEELPVSISKHHFAPIVPGKPVIDLGTEAVTKAIEERFKKPL